MLRKSNIHPAAPLNSWSPPKFNWFFLWSCYTLQANSLTGKQETYWEIADLHQYPSPLINSNSQRKSAYMPGKSSQNTNNIPELFHRVKVIIILLVSTFQILPNPTMGKNSSKSPASRCRSGSFPKCNGFFYGPRPIPGNFCEHLSIA